MDKIGLKRLHHVSFAVSNLAESKHFFGEVLGLPEDNRPDFDFAGAWYALGDRQLHLIEKTGGRGEARGQISRSDHMAMEVADLDAVKARLNECGVPFVEGGERALGHEPGILQRSRRPHDRIRALPRLTTHGESHAGGVMLSRSPAASGQCAGAAPTGAEPRASGRAGDWIRAGNIGGAG